MSADNNARPERRQYAKRLVSELQQERHQVWSLYCHIADLKPFEDKINIKQELTNFAQIMIDYVSLGHFGIFERLLTGNERRERILNHATEIYPEFSKTTDAVISFNDQYSAENKKFSLKNLETDLSELGEQLAKRMEMEDDLCKLLLHR